MDVSFDDLISIANDAVPFRHLYDFFKLDYRRADGSTQCRCPFHGVDRHPSARIYEDTNSWFCFTCGFAKTPLFFFKSMMGLPLTDAVAEFYKYFRTDILHDNPDLANEAFTADDIRLAYTKHLATGPLGLVPQQQQLLRGALSGTIQFTVTNMTDPSAIYLATILTWREFYQSPNFLPCYFAFVRYMTRLQNPEDTTIHAEFSAFLAGLKESLRAYAA